MKNKPRKSCFRCFLLTLAGLTLTVAAAAQSITVKGNIVDKAGTVVGASVVEKGNTKNGVVTDFDGNFTIKVQSGAALIVSYIGYKTKEVAAAPIVNVTLDEDVSTLNEVVVVGYGSLSKKEVSTSIVQVDRRDFNLGAMNNPMEMVSGKVAGLNVNTTAVANPNGSSSLQVRGATSVSAGNAPLIVIDGVAGGDIRNIAAQDIESITVLKDAGSAAIYGTRGANGVILVTTKRGSGEPGQTVVTYDSYVALNMRKPGPDILSADEFRRSRRGTDYGADTDWYGLITRTNAYDINQYISIDSSTKNGFYGASFNYKRANGLDIVSMREEFGARLAVQQRVLNNRLQFDGSLSARRVNETWGNDVFFDTALSMNPTIPVRNEDGSYYQPTSPTGATNPVAELELRHNNGQRMYVLSSASARFNILQGERQMLNTTLTYSLQYNDLKSQYYAPSNSAESFWNGYKGRAEMKYQKWYTNRLEWLGNYQLVFGEHTIRAVVGYNYERSIWEQIGGSNNNFSFDKTLYWDLGSGSYLKDGKASLYSGKSESTLIGFFGRLNYNWRDMIFASASIRHEGSTKFGDNNKWGNFPAASVALEMTRIGFMNGVKAVVESLKPRVSYGVTGRSDFDAYKSISTYSVNGSYLFNGQWVTGYAPSSNANPDLAWEKSTSLNVGVDFVLLNRLRGSVEYFDRRSNDLLYTYSAPQPPFVYSTILVNVGSIKNTGLEASIEADIFNKGALRWTSGINYSFGTSRLTRLSNNIYKASYLDLYMKPGSGTTEYFFREQEGGLIGQFYGYEYAGVDENGNMLIYDDKNEKIPVGQADAKYKRYIGNGAPRHFLSWNNNLTWRNFDLGLMFRGVFGFDIFNMRKYGMGLQGAGTDNVLRSAYLEDQNIKTGGGVISSFFLEDGSYFKLDNVTLGYTFRPKKHTLLESLRVYLSAKNLFTITGYSGNDPSIVETTGITPGVDSNSAYPIATQLSLGLTIRFK